MFESGAFVAEHVSPVEDTQIQPNGVDLTLETIFEQAEPGRIGTQDKTIGERGERDIEVGHEDRLDKDRRDAYRLSPDGYVVRYAETVEIPEGHVGFVFPRSSLLRNSCMLDTAVWDAGYEGRGEGLLEVHHEIEIEPGARIAQLVLAEAGHEETYTGDYQGEGTE